MKPSLLQITLLLSLIGLQSDIFAAHRDRQSNNQNLAAQRRVIRINIGNARTRVDVAERRADNARQAEAHARRSLELHRTATTLSMTAVGDLANAAAEAEGPEAVATLAMIGQRTIAHLNENPTTPLNLNLTPNQLSIVTRLNTVPAVVIARDSAVSDATALNRAETALTNAQTELANANRALQIANDNLVAAMAQDRL